MVRSETFPGRYGQLVADLLGEDQGDHSGLAVLHQFGRSRTGAATPRLEDVTQMAVRITLASCQDDFAHVDTSEGTVDAARRGGRILRSRFGFKLIKAPLCEPTAVWVADFEVPEQRKPVRESAFIRSDRPLEKKLEHRLAGMRSLRARRQSPL